MIPSFLEAKPSPLFGQISSSSLPAPKLVRDGQEASPPQRSSQKLCKVVLASGDVFFPNRCSFVVIMMAESRSDYFHVPSYLGRKLRRGLRRGKALTWTGTSIHSHPCSGAGDIVSILKTVELGTHNLPTPHRGPLSPSIFPQSPGSGQVHAGQLLGVLGLECRPRDSD